MVSADEGVLVYVYRGALFKIAEGVQVPKAGSLLFCRHLELRPGERVLELGTGAGLAAVVAARAGCRVVATDVVPEAVACARENAALNGAADRVEVRLGDCYEPVAGMTFDLICTNPPQMPTPPGRDRSDPVAAADNGGVDGWEILDRAIQGAPRHLAPGGRLVFTLFAFLGQKAAMAKLEAVGLAPRVIGREVQAFPRIGYERLDHIRSVDTEGVLPRTGLPRTVERFVVQGTKPR
ncbi:MAG: methyltransferase [Candidatus Rokubacteria bacterium]|nr:methyltransferase [Candidatus Rokubacteria bacterium]